MIEWSHTTTKGHGMVIDEQDEGMALEYERFCEERNLAPSAEAEEAFAEWAREEEEAAAEARAEALAEAREMDFEDMVRDWA